MIGIGLAIRIQLYDYEAWPWRRSIQNIVNLPDLSYFEDQGKPCRGALPRDWPSHCGLDDFQKEHWPLRLGKFLNRRFHNPGFMAKRSIKTQPPKEVTFSSLNPTLIDSTFCCFLLRNVVGSFVGVFGAQVFFAE